MCIRDRFDESGKETYSFVNEVIELSKATLDASLFEIPAGYREVKNSTELYSSVATPAPTTAPGKRPGKLPADNDSGFKSNLESEVYQTPSTNAAELGPKKEGVVRLGIASVETTAVGDGLNAEEFASAIQNTLNQYLKTRSIEVVQIEAKLQPQVEAEARQKECDYVIYTNAAHRKGGGMFGKVLGKMSETLAHTAYGSGNTAGNVGKMTVISAAAVSGNIKSKDEVSLDIKVLAVEAGKAILTKQFRQKARSDGEDIITPIAEQAARAIIDAAAIN